MQATPPSATSVTIRLTLNDVQPAVWRRFVIRSDATLPMLHDAIQDVMGWEDRHLHKFFVGNDPYAATTSYEMKISLDEYDDGTGVLEDDVRVSELLSTVGDSLGYEYDFGDGWGHRLVVESVDNDVDDLSVSCVGGMRACPPEDCGGPHGYLDLLAVLHDPQRPEYEDYLRWIGRFDRDHFDKTQANARIESRRQRHELSAWVQDRFPRLTTLLDRAPLEYHHRLSAALSNLGQRPAQIDAVMATVAMTKVTWFLTRIGTEGITLTAAGYLPPKVVTAMRRELDWGSDWIGAANREVDSPPVHWMRQSAKELGLVRVLHGRLILTREGTKLAGDPVGLWNHAAARLPLGREAYEKDAGTLLLAAVAAALPDSERNSMLLESMEVLGWRIPDRERIHMIYLARPTVEFLTLVDALPWSVPRDRPIPAWGRDFALQCLER